MKTRMLLVSLALAMSCSANAYAQIEKPRLAIQEIVADTVMMGKLSDSKKKVLKEILQGIDPLLMIAIVDNNQFDVVARSDYDLITKEQRIQNSGDVDPNDSQIAQMFKRAGVKYVAVLKIVSFEEDTQTANYDGSALEKRKIEVRVTLQLFDTTSAIAERGVTFRVEEMVTAEVGSGIRSDGRATNTIIDTMKYKIAFAAANKITEKLITPKVLAYDDGVVLFTRGEGSEVAVGQYWEIFSQGKEMVMDGISYGAKPKTVGWCKVEDVYKGGYSRAVAIMDNGIDKGHRLRLYENDGIPEGINPEARPKGSGSNSFDEHAQQRTSQQNASATEGSGKTQSREGQANSEPVTLALFVKNVSELSDNKTDVFEEYLKSQLVSRSISIISRSEVMNAVSAYSNSGSNKGTGDPENTLIDRLLSDRSSAQKLAQYMDADGLIVASITSSDSETQKTHGGLEKATYSVDITWNVLDGQTGGSLAGNLSRATAVVDGARRFNIDRLLSDNAIQIGNAVKAALSDEKTRRLSAAEATDSAFIRVALSSLTIPQIVKQEDGTYQIAPSKLQLEPECNVLIDGIYVGSAPGRVNIPAGRHKMIIEGTSTIIGVEIPINIQPGAELTISVELSNDAKRQWNELSKEVRREWQEQLRFLDELKENEAKREQDLVRLKGSLEQELIRTKALVEFMKNSSIKIDTSNLTSLNSSTPVHIWNNLWRNNPWRNSND